MEPKHTKAAKLIYDVFLVIYCIAAVFLMEISEEAPFLIGTPLKFFAFTFGAYLGQKRDSAIDKLAALLSKK